MSGGQPWDPARRAAALALFQAGWRPKSVAHILGIGEATARLWRRKPPTEKYSNRLRIAGIALRLAAAKWERKRIAAHLGCSRSVVDRIIDTHPRRGGSPLRELVGTEPDDDFQAWLLVSSLSKADVQCSPSPASTSTCGPDRRRCSEVA